MKKLIDQLYRDEFLNKEELKLLLELLEEDSRNYLYDLATKKAKQTFQNKIYVRGLIEFTNFCKNDCYYCGIRCSNLKADRYRLTKDEILECSDIGYDLGFRTYVLQGGEDLSYTDEDIADIVQSLKARHPQVAITLSIGERSREAYEKFKAAGADRYLLRHETINPVHYSRLHPENLTLENRIRCLDDLKDIGFQVGVCMMVGSPYQTVDNLVEDLMFIKEFEPHMVGIGPFLSHKDTPFANMENGSFERTLDLIAIVRLLRPKTLIPATTALGTINPKGREAGILVGANVLMPNLSPTSVRKKYMLYDNKICTGDEAAECQKCLANRVSSIGYEIVVDPGHYPT